MGQEIDQIQFDEEHFNQFYRRLSDETKLLAQWFEQKKFDNQRIASGFELEIWIIDQQYKPKPINQLFLETMNNPMVSPELAAFNVEFNYTAQDLTADALSKHHQEMQQLCLSGVQAARALDSHLAMIGIMPTVLNTDLTMKNVSSMKRYAALNEQVLKLRNGRPLGLDIHGKEILRLKHEDVMLESATTSFQIHLQVPMDMALRAYNASIISSAPLVAISANSPYLFQKDLWAETRIPLFEQAVETGGIGDAAHGPMRRVSFGSGYARESLMEIFTENIEHFPILLPMLIDEPLESFSNLRLHNGTLWRWNRPLIGMDHGQKPHLRIEQRVVPAGPTIADCIANACFFYGLNYALCTQEEAPESLLAFDLARDNFYHAAQLGLDASISWLDGKKHKLQTLVLNELLPLARSGLEQLKVNPKDVEHYLGIIQDRVQNECNGANWQRAFVSKHGPDMANLVKAYLENQNRGDPVHLWGL